MKSSDLKSDLYQSIFWEEDWAHQKYYGWNLVKSKPGLRVLRKNKLLVSRFLILVADEGHEILESTVQQLSRFLGLCEITIHDFGANEVRSVVIAGSRFEQLGQSGRLLNVATMVIDLFPDKEAIVAQMSSTTRNEIRKAELLGIDVEICSRPDAILRGSFNAALEKLAEERQLHSVDPLVLERMYSDDRARLFVARKGDEILSYAHVYKAGNKAIFMYGVNPLKNNDGVGSYIQYKVICHLKEHNVRWYDMGGVPSFDTSNGIYNFKKKFGSKPIPLGCEYRYRSPLIRAAISMREYARKISFVAFSK